MAAISGLMIAIAAYFIGNRLLPVTLENRGDQEIQVFFLVWLAALIHALLRPNRSGWQEQVALGTVLWLAVPVINVLTTDSHLFTAVAWQHPALASVDLVCLAFAGAGGYTFWRLIRKPAPAKRAPRKKPAKRTAPSTTAPAGENA